MGTWKDLVRRQVTRLDRREARVAEFASSFGIHCVSAKIFAIPTASLVREKFGN
jgi:hypothetical protein